MNVNAMIVSKIKQRLAEARAAVVKYEEALAAFGESSPAKTKKGPTKKRKAPTPDASGLTPIQKAQQARSDSVAVQKGTATPEQIERHEARLAAKGGVAVPAGASLVPAAD